MDEQKIPDFPIEKDEQNEDMTLYEDLRAFHVLLINVPSKSTREIMERILTEIADKVKLLEEQSEDLTPLERKWISLLHDPRVKSFNETQVFYEDGSIGPSPEAERIMATGVTMPLEVLSDINKEEHLKRQMSKDAYEVIR